MTKRKDYDVGYGKPPKSKQFEKGESGNAKGRPPGARNFAGDLADILGATVEISENGQQKKVSSQKAALLRLLEKALKGDARALDRLLELAQSFSADRAAQESERRLTNTETDILERFRQDILLEEGLSGDGTEGSETND